MKPTVCTGRLEQRLQENMEALNLPQQMSINEAIGLAIHDKLNRYDILS